MIHACYTYKGKDGKFGLRKGKSYNLLVYRQNIVERLFGSYPFSWNIIVSRPFKHHSPMMHYRSWDDFECEWKKAGNRSS